MSGPPIRGGLNNQPILDDGDSDSDADSYDYHENNNDLLPRREDSDEDADAEWCNHFNATDAPQVRHLIRQRYRCCTCNKKAHFACVHKDCVRSANSSCCKDVSHIFSHMATHDHPAIVHHKLRVVLCTRCNIRVSIRQFLRRHGVPTDFVLGEVMQPESVNIQALCGYVNFGNTCYMNAVFQLLGHCSPFSDFFINFKPPTGWLANPAAGNNTTLQLAVDFRVMWGAFPVPFISPWKMIYCIRSQLPSFENFQQQDASEFLRSLFDILDREQTAFGDQEEYGDYFDPDNNMGMQGNRNVPRRTIITQVFQGTLENQIQCHRCDFQSRTYETFLDLSVPILSEDEEFGYMFKTLPETNQNFTEKQDNSDRLDENGDLDPGYVVHEQTQNKISLKDCLGRFFQNSTLAGDNQYSCSKCNTLVDATKSTKATILPEVIFIQLKRFRHTAYGSHKVNKVVEFPVDAMDFGCYTVSGQTTMYDLVGFIVHEGTTVECGHYFTFIRHEQDRAWYRFDDLNIQRCDPTRVAKEQPYILMLRKRANKDISNFETLKEHVVDKNFPTNSGSRFRERCPAIWEVIQEALENDIVNNSENVKRFKAQLEKQKKMKELIGEVPHSYYIYKTFLDMMKEIQTVSMRRHSRKKKNSKSPDNTLEAIRKLQFHIEKWQKSLTKEQWFVRQMNNFDKFLNETDHSAETEEAKKESEQQQQ